MCSNTSDEVTARTVKKQTSFKLRIKIKTIQNCPSKWKSNANNFLTPEDRKLFCFEVETALFSETSVPLYLPTRSGISEDNQRDSHYGVKLKFPKRDTCQQAVNTTSLVKHVKCLTSDVVTYKQCHCADTDTVSRVGGRSLTVI